MTLKLNNGIEIPQIGTGTWTLKGDIATDNVCMALKAGFMHIDTAQMYDSCTGVQRRKGTKNYDTATEYYEKAAALGAPGAGKKITALGKLIRIVKYS